MPGQARIGETRQAWCGEKRIDMERKDVVGTGRAGKARCGRARCGGAWSGKTRHGRAGKE